MKYQILVLDLDGTLTNSKKEITKPTLDALIEIQEAGKKVVLASGRPTCGVAPLAEQLHLERYGSYILSFNGARITDCRSGEIIYNKTIPEDVIPTIYEIASKYPVDLLGYLPNTVLSGLQTNDYSRHEASINKIPLAPVSDFCEQVLNQKNNKFLLTGNPDIIAQAKAEMERTFRGLLNIYCSEPYFLEIMPQNIDKAYSLEKLLHSIGLNADDMICCGDGYNDITMIEYAGLGVAMENAQPLLREKADFITKSNDDDGILYVINQFMRD